MLIDALYYYKHEIFAKIMCAYILDYAGVSMFQLEDDLLTKLHVKDISL